MKCYGVTFQLMLVVFQYSTKWNLPFFLILELILVFLGVKLGAIHMSYFIPG